jgi:hypothetical protein
MARRFPYWVYVVGVFVVWAVVLLIASMSLSASKFRGVLIFGCGFLLGVVGASIARKVYK